jgi:hypothetical protein
LSENGNKSPLRRLVPKIVKAVVKSIFWLILLYVLPAFMLSFLGSTLPEGVPNLFSPYEQVFGTFTIVVIFFVIASEVTSGTIFQHVFNIGKALVLMVLIVLSFEGGIIEMDFQNVHITADLIFYLTMLLTIDLVGLAKSVLQAINFLSEKAESQLPPLKPSG